MSKPTLYVGQIALAYALTDQVRNGFANPKAERIVGAVIASKELPDAQPGGIPNRLLTIRGQSGRVAEVDMIRHWVQLFNTWDEAAEARSNP